MHALWMALLAQQLASVRMMTVMASARMMTEMLEQELAEWNVWC